MNRELFDLAGRSVKPSEFHPTKAAAKWPVISLLLLASALGACSSSHESSDERKLAGPVVVGMDFDAPSEPVDLNGPIQLTGARNEWISFALQCYVAYLLMQPDSAEWFR